jgi:hypothetical protein
MAQKWNYKKHEYEPYDLPANCRLYDADLSKKVACCQCGKEYEFGAMYTSREIHSEVGFGYPVCENCYKVETTKEKLENK